MNKIKHIYGKHILQTAQSKSTKINQAEGYDKEKRAMERTKQDC